MPPYNCRRAVKIFHGDPCMGRNTSWAALQTALFRPLTLSMKAKGLMLMRSLLCQYDSSGRKETSSRLPLKQPPCVYEIILILCLILGGATDMRAAQGISPDPLKLAYTARVERPTTHMISIEIVARQVQSPALDFVIPAWAPGRYAIYDFAKGVQEFSAEGSDHRPLRWIKLDKQTWRVDAGGAGTVEVRYRVFANDLTGSFSQVDAVHANLNGPSVFMYVDGHKADPIVLTIEAPAAWKVVSGFSTSTTERTFHAPNYDRLVDTPLEICAE